VLDRILSFSPSPSLFVSWLSLCSRRVNSCCARRRQNNVVIQAYTAEVLAPPARSALLPSWSLCRTSSLGRMHRHFCLSCRWRYASRHSIDDVGDAIVGCIRRRARPHDALGQPRRDVAWIVALPEQSVRVNTLWQLARSVLCSPMLETVVSVTYHAGPPKPVSRWSGLVGLALRSRSLFVSCQHDSYRLAGDRIATTTRLARLPFSGWRRPPSSHY
jgi:hypothetical protein